MEKRQNLETVFTTFMDLQDFHDFKKFKPKHKIPLLDHNKFKETIHKDKNKQKLSEMEVQILYQIRYGLDRELARIDKRFDLSNCETNHYSLFYVLYTNAINMRITGHIYHKLFVSYSEKNDVVTLVIEFKGHSGDIKRVDIASDKIFTKNYFYQIDNFINKPNSEFRSIVFDNSVPKPTPPGIGYNFNYKIIRPYINYSIGKREYELLNKIKNKMMVTDRMDSIVKLINKEIKIGIQIKNLDHFRAFCRVNNYHRTIVVVDEILHPSNKWV